MSAAQRRKQLANSSPWLVKLRATKLASIRSPPRTLRHTRRILTDNFATTLPPASRVLGLGHRNSQFPADKALTQPLARPPSRPRQSQRCVPSAERRQPTGVEVVEDSSFVQRLASHRRGRTTRTFAEPGTMPEGASAGVGDPPPAAAPGAPPEGPVPRDPLQEASSALVSILHADDFLAEASDEPMHAGTADLPGRAGARLRHLTRLDANSRLSAGQHGAIHGLQRGD